VSSTQQQQTSTQAVELPCSSTAGTNTTEALSLQAIISTSANVGDSLCVEAVLQNNNQTTVSSISGSITITNQNGQVVYQTQLVPFEAGSLKLTYGNQLSFQFLWNTTQSYRGVTAQAGAYTVNVVVQFDGMQQLTNIECTTSVNLS